MIRSKAEYAAYLEADRVALERRRTLSALLMDDVWKFQRSLRRLEYLINCDGNAFLILIVKAYLSRLGARLGFSIPPNVFGPGLSIAHYGTIVVNQGARVGANCRIHAGVNVGTAAGHSDAAPTVGDNCYIAPGAKVFGAITIGPGTVIGANAVVNKSFPQGGVTLGGIPARVISEKGSKNLLPGMGAN